MSQRVNLLPWPLLSSPTSRPKCLCCNLLLPGIWTTLQAPVLQPRKYLGVCAVEGRLFAIGGMNAQRERLATVEAYDPREGVWKVLINSFTAFRSPSAEGCLFLLPLCRLDRLRACQGLPR